MIAEHPSTNSHQSVSAEGNAWKVYCKTQCDFTLLPSAGGGERRGGSLSYRRLIQTGVEFDLLRSFRKPDWLQEVILSDLYDLLRTKKLFSHDADLMPTFTRSLIGEDESKRGPEKSSLSQHG